MRRDLSMVWMTRLRLLLGSGQGARNDGDGGNGAAASSGRNTVIAGRRLDGEQDGRKGEQSVQRGAGEGWRREREALSAAVCNVPGS